MTYIIIEMNEEEDKKSDSDKNQENKYSQYMEAIQIEGKRFYRCVLCDYNSEYKAAITRHLDRKKSCNEIDPFKCKICGKKYKNRTQLEAHQSKRNACGILDKIVDETDVVKVLPMTLENAENTYKTDILKNQLQTKTEEYNLLKKRCDNAEEELKYWKENTVSEMKKLYKKQMVLYMKHKDYDYETFIYALTKWNDGINGNTMNDLTYFMDRIAITRIKEFLSLVKKYNNSLLPFINKYIETLSTRNTKKVFDKDVIIYEMELKKNLPK